MKDEGFNSKVEGPDDLSSAPRLITPGKATEKEPLAASSEGLPPNNPFRLTLCNLIGSTRVKGEKYMIKLKITWRYCLAFYCVIMLYVSLHELVHHFTGYLICGEWGYKSFNYFETACEDALLATYMGPAFSFLIMYVGAYFLRNKFSDFTKHLGFAMIFAQLPFQRMVNPFFKMNDEFYASARLFGNTQLVYWLVIITIWAICLPPLIKAYRSIENKNRTIWFLFYLVLFPYLLWGPVFGILEFLMVNKQFLATPIIGIGLLFIINEVITIVAYVFAKKHIDPNYLNSPSVYKYL